MGIHLVDGTYGLFRHYFALPSARDSDGREVAAMRQSGGRSGISRVPTAEQIRLLLQQLRPASAFG